MNKIEEFIIPNTGGIALLIPPLSEKFNYYYSEISYEIAEQWLRKCEDIIKQIDRDYPLSNDRKNFLS